MNASRKCAYALATLAVSLGALAGSNQPTTPCGTFTLPVASGHAAGGVRCTVSFSFSPSACSVPACTCSQVAYVQIIRARDVDRNEYIQPFEQQEQRMVLGESAPQLNGWALDRRANNHWGYFGGINGTPITFSSSKLQPGTNTSPVTPAVMKDRPERWRKHVEFEAVSVPVCMDETGACSKKLLGYRHWSFKVLDNGSGSNPDSRTANQWEREAVDLAIAKWNEEATPSMKQFVGLTTLQ
jgi:hypothetical protein